MFIVFTKILAMLTDSVINAEAVETGTEFKERQIELSGILSRPLFTH